MNWDQKQRATFVTAHVENNDIKDVAEDVRRLYEDVRRMLDPNRDIN